MKYFLHDTNSFQDEKITELFIQHGYEGLGLFYTILEKLAMQEKPVKTIVLKKQLSVGKKLEKVWSYLEEIELIYSNNGETFNENILKFSEKYQIKKEKTKERVSQWRDNQRDSESVTRYNDVRNEPKVNESKVKLNKEEGIGSDANASTQPPAYFEIEKTSFEEEKKERTPPIPAAPPNNRRVMDKPTLEQVHTHFHLQMSPAWLAEKFFNYYESNGWKVGKNPMRKWQATANNWISEEKTSPTRNQPRPHANGNQQTGPSAISSNKPTGGYVFDLDAELARRSGGYVDSRIVYDTDVHVVE